MKFCIVRQPTSNAARSPFRVIYKSSQREVEWVNRFLDRECVLCFRMLLIRSPRVFRSPTGAVHPWVSAGNAPL